MDYDYKADRQWKKLALLKRSVILSYAHIVLNKEMFETIRYDSKFTIIDMLQELGFTDDILQEYYWKGEPMLSNIDLLISYYSSDTLALVFWLVIAICIHALTFIIHWIKN